MSAVSNPGRITETINTPATLEECIAIMNTRNYFTWKDSSP